MSLSHCYLDHIVVTSPSLAAGAAFVARILGVQARPGGAHPRMGTHNLLLRLGDSLFLEIISPDPAAPAPQRPRWFGLDGLRSDSRPALSAWVARTADVTKTAGASSGPLGNVESMSRGPLNWLITIPADGSIPLDGIGPAVIEWRTDRHPASKLQDLGLSLVKLELFHPEPARVSRFLSSIEFSGPLSVSTLDAGKASHLVAHIDTPQGLRQLSQP